MRYSVLAEKYARALFELTATVGHQEAVFNELRAIQEIFAKDDSITEFLHSPLIKAEDKATALGKALAGAGLRPESLSFILLLASKGRLGIFAEIVASLQTLSDESNGVTRGVVRSAGVLGPEERKRIEEIVGRVTQKQVILNFKEDSQVIGGLIAEVGSYTFDDTLTSHLRRLKEEITRRAQ